MAIDYVHLFTKGTIAWKSALSVLSLTLLTAGRVAPIIALSPFFGARVLPNSAKLALVLCFVAIILPKMAVSVSSPLAFDFRLIFLFLRELMLGLIFGIFLSLPFLMTSSAGVYIDHQRGAASLMTNDPTIQNQSSPIGTLYNLLLIVIFWSIGGPFFVLDSFYRSYDLIPPDQFVFPLFLENHSFIHQKIIHALYIFVATSAQLCMPALLSVLMIDTFLGVINRLAPQVQITFLGMGLKSWFALFMVCIGLFPFTNQLTKQIESCLQDFQELIFFCKQVPDSTAERIMNAYTVDGSEENIQIPFYFHKKSGHDDMNRK